LGLWLRHLPRLRIAREWLAALAGAPRVSNFRFLHAADLHLDSPLRGLEDDPAAPAEQIRNASRIALGRLVDLALEEDVAFLLIAGDVYDGDWPDYRTGHFFMQQAARLTRAGKHVFVIRGNHDAQNRMTRSLRSADRKLVVFDAAASETRRVEELGVAIHGQSFANQEETRNLAKSYPPPIAGLLNIGMLHSSVDGRPDHGSYAPCTVEDLRALNYDYVALGHIHTREVLSEAPWIVFPGNLQGRHANEPGAKGATMVTVADGRIAGIEHRVLDAFRWARVEVDLTGAEVEDVALSAIHAALAGALAEADGRHLAARVTLTGATAMHGGLAHDLAGLRERVVNEANQLDPTRLWIEAVKLRTTPAVDLDALRERADALGLLVRQIDTLATEPPADLLGNWQSDLLAKLPAQFLPDDHPLHDAANADLLGRARDLLLAALAGG
jgi:DNA repair protein SbcD/Mre11